MNPNVLHLIKNELNFLYHEPTRPGDGGWFCREHAFHLYFVAKMMGMEAAILAGNFVAKITTNRFLQSYSASIVCGHYWNTVNGIRPIDISLSFKYVHNPAEDVGPVYQQDLDGRYAIVTALDDESCKKVSEGPQTKVICYCQQKELAPDCNALLRDPFIVLIKPPKDALTELMGEDFFNRITMHVYGVAIGKQQPLYETGIPLGAAMMFIRNGYPAANSFITSVLNGMTPDEFQQKMTQSEG